MLTQLLDDFSRKLTLDRQLDRVEVFHISHDDTFDPDAMNVEFVLSSMEESRLRAEAHPYHLGRFVEATGATTSERCRRFAAAAGDRIAKSKGAGLNWLAEADVLQTRMTQEWLGSASRVKAQRGRPY